MSIYERITADIVSAIEAGSAGEWRMPWHHNGSPTTRPLNIDRGAGYRGINTIILWAAAEAAGYPTGYWGTYRQWAARGAQVRKGEHGTGVVFWRSVEDHDEVDEDGDPKRRLIARGYTVFNAAQVDGWEPPRVHVLSGSLRDEFVDRFAANTGIEVQHRGDRAFYAPGFDRVVVPEFERFRSPDGYYSTLLHELGHATGHESRLARDLTGRFGSEAYAMEELVAELTSAFVCADLGIACEPRSDHAAYVANWLKVLKGDVRAVFTAASAAQKSATWMHERQPDYSRESDVDSVEQTTSSLCG
jgi:antirestriction protein ArdC